MNSDYLNSFVNDVDENEVDYRAIENSVKRNSIASFKWQLSILSDNLDNQIVFHYYIPKFLGKYNWIEGFKFLMNDVRFDPFDPNVINAFVDTKSYELIRILVDHSNKKGHHLYMYNKGKKSCPFCVCLIKDEFRLAKEFLRELNIDQEYLSGLCENFILKNDQVVFLRKMSKLDPALRLKWLNKYSNTFGMYSIFADIDLNRLIIETKTIESRRSSSLVD